MIGNVSTEESRKEMRKSPGAPKPVANATTFCFHPLKLVGKSNSSNSFVVTHLSMTLARGEAEDVPAHLLREGSAIEMIHEDLHERRAVQVRKLGNFADHAHMAESFDRFPVLAILIADKHHAMHGKFGRV